MKLKTLLTALNDKKMVEAPVVYFSGERCPILFFSQLMKKIKALDQAVKTINPVGIDWQTLESTLSTTFLGQTQTVWLGDCSTFTPTLKKKLFAFLHDYKGPHTVFCFVATKDAPKNFKNLIKIDEPLQKVEIELLFKTLWAAGSAEKFLALVKTDYKTLSLDSIMLLSHYSTVMGKKSDLFLRSWYEKIVLPETSLFTLSQCFFARKKDLFFRSWVNLKDDYAAPFWTTFWSEQLWRAYHVANLNKQQKFNEAKQMSYRLPFSFMQRDWKTVSLKELNNAHSFLYQVDCKVKSGATEGSLEVFYNKFMSKQF